MKNISIMILISFAFIGLSWGADSSYYNELVVAARARKAQELSSKPTSATDAAIRSALNTYTEQLAALRTQQAELQAKVKAAEEKYYSYSAKDRMEAFVNHTGVAGTALQEVRDARTQLNGIEKQISETDKKVSNLDGSTRAMTEYFARQEKANQEAIDDAGKAALKKVQALESKLKAADLSAQIKDFRIDQGEIKFALNALESKWDNALLGLYLQDKIQKTLNSNALCSAVANCEGGKRKGDSKVGSEGLKEIFNESTAKANRVDGKGTAE